MSDFYERLEEAVTSNHYFHILDSNTRLANGATIFSRLAPKNSENVPYELDPATVPPEQTQSSPSLGDSSAPSLPPPGDDEQPSPRYLVMDMRIHLNDVKASVPVFAPGLSYVNQALVRPIVAYINAKRTYIPIGCRIVKRASDFDGSWSVYDCGLMDDASAEVYAAFARDVEDQQSRSRRLRKVGFWTLSLAVHALFMGMAGTVI